MVLVKLLGMRPWLWFPNPRLCRSRRRRQPSCRWCNPLTYEKVKKAYPAYFDTYAEMPKLRRWLDGIGNLYCIGRNGQHRYNNMDHSMLTAMMAVDCLFDEKKDRKAIWQVNTEKEYHEEG